MKAYSSICFLLLFTALFGACKPESSKIGAQGTALPETIDFNFHIKPILSDRCFKCHGPDEKAQKGNLRLDEEQYAFAALDSLQAQFAIVPGAPEKSELIHRIFHEDPEIKMPPPSSNLVLHDEEKALLQRWIEQGAKWEKHWAFIPPNKSKLPIVKQKSWPKNAIDHFTLAKMEARGLSPQDDASKHHLIRRVAFDLIGRSPSPDEIKDFLEDQSSDAYSKVIDQYLQSPAYGERMAAPWLDVARYADTDGYQDDFDRSMWPWRDWVIKAFNENMPFNQFITWQLAGDLLPNASYEQKLATGFNRNHMINGEGGIVEEEYRVEYVADRTQTFGTAFLGLTLQCARCHDHKYDPISQKEFYQLFSFFNNIPERGLDGRDVAPAPNLPLPQEQIDKMKGFVDAQVTQQATALRNLKHEKRSAFKAWLATQDTSPKSISGIPKDEIAAYSMDWIEHDNVLVAQSGQVIGQVGGNAIEAQGKFGGAVEFNDTSFIDFGQLANFNRQQPFSFSFFIKTNTSANFASIISKSGQGRQAWKGYEVYLRRKWIVFSMRGKSPKHQIYVRPQDEFVRDKWVHIAVSYDGSGSGKGVRIYYDGKSMPLNVEQDNLSGSIRTSSSLRMGKQPNTPVGMFETFIDEFRIYDRVLQAEEVQALATYDPNTLATKQSPDAQENEQSFSQYLYHHDTAFQEQSRKMSQRIRAQRHMYAQLIPTMVMEELDSLRPAYILRRGAYDARGERVFPQTPKRIMSLSKDLPANRLGLAKWLTDPQHPLTSRVIVNRLWQMIFGRGLVSTVDDFGNQGTLPSHPKLLDWLAVEFVESGWDVQHMLKLMLESATYQQSSISSPSARQIDPNNIWLARSSQSRLPAEVIRDNALYISGLLVDSIGGPSVKPYQPDGLWIETSSGRGTDKYVQSTGDALYRKSLYTYWKRGVPPPYMTNFDATSRDYCLVQRQNTSTPLQALNLLNDPQFVEAARLLGQRMLQEGGDDDQSRIRFGFRLATSRYPSTKELNLLSQIRQKAYNDYLGDVAKRGKLLDVGEYSWNSDLDPAQAAAYTIVASALLNLDEAISKY